MDKISNLFNSIYKKFILRDLMSIVFSGAILTIGICYTFNIVDLIIIEIEQFEKKTLIWIGLIILFYIVGIFINELREIITFTFYPNIKDKYKNISEGIKKWRLINNIKIYYWNNQAYMNNKSISETRERKVVMYQSTGNVSIALFILAIFNFKNLICGILIFTMSLFFAAICIWIHLETVYYDYINKDYYKKNIVKKKTELTGNNS
jgi:hypothetical protein